MKSAALITGGAKRIGRETALFLAEKGYDIALTYNSSDQKAFETAEDIEKLGSRCKIYKMDLCEEKALAGLAAAAAKDFPNLRLLINNASIFKPSTVRETTFKLFDEHIATNFRAPFFLSKEFANTVKKGTIVNLLDTRIKSLRTSYAAYSLSKIALAEFTRMSALEFAPDIRVNAVAPGLILPPEGKDLSYLKNLAKSVPLRRHGAVENIMSALNFLIENEFVTGQIIFCDGGENLNR